MKHTIRKAAILSLAALIAALSLSACKVTLTLDKTHGLYDKRHEITYVNASTVYEATELVKEYGKMQLTDADTYTLYTIPDEDGTAFLATEEYDILHASDRKMPTLLEMAPSALHICTDGSERVHIIHTMENQVTLASIVQLYTDGASIPTPDATPTRQYTVRFASTEYPGFFYKLTYLEYATDVTYDGNTYGRYFLRDRMANTCVPINDSIRNALDSTTIPTTPEKETTNVA